MEKVKSQGRNRRARLSGRWGLLVGWGLVALSLWIMPGGGRSEEPLPVDKSLLGLKISILGYIDYSEGQSALPAGLSQHYNRFALTRGYLTVEKTVTDWLGMRMTLDLTQNQPDKVVVGGTGYTVGDDLTGSYVVRLKYLYGVFNPPDLGFLTNMKIELGLGHIPWLDFEESINIYRCQGTMPIERAGVFNSADLGVSMMGYFGGKLPDAEAKTGNPKYSGRYGSWHLGVFNGSGYHAPEANQDKVFEGRISLRPLPDLVPGLQLSYFYLTGQGNTSYEWRHDTYWPEYRVQIGMLSFEHPAVVFTGQYFTSSGNAKGNWVYNAGGDALPTEGYSYFLDLKVPGTERKMSLIGRYDYFNIDPDHELVRRGDTAYTMTLYGLAYNINAGNLIMLAYERTDYQGDADVKTKLPKADNDLGDDDRVQFVYQARF